MPQPSHEENSKEPAALAAIHQVNQQVLDNRPLDETLQFICDYVADTFCYRLAWLGLKRESGVVSIRGKAGHACAYLDGLQVRWDETPEGSGPVGLALRTGRAQTVHTSQPEFARWSERAQAHGLRSCTVLPLLAGGQTLGVLALYAQRATAMSPGTERLLVGFAAQAAGALRHALHLERMRLHEAALVSISHGVALHDHAGRVFWVNPAFCRLTGYSDKEILGRNLSLLYAAPAEAARAGLEPGERLCRRKDGTLYVEEESVMPILNAQGDIGYYVSVKKDITDRKQSEGALREAQERLQALVSNTPVIFFALDKDGVFTQSEGKGLATLGLMPGQAVGLSVWDLYRDSPAMLDTLRRVFAGEALSRVEEVGPHHFESHYTPVRDRQGQVSGLLGISTDVSERRGAEQAIRESDARHAAMVEAALDCIISIDHERRIIEWNPAAERTFGWTRAEALGQEMIALTVPPTSREAYRQSFDQHLATGTGLALDQRIEVTRLRKDGVEVPVELSVTAIGAGPQTVWTGFLRDITGRKAAEAEQKDYEARLERLAYYDSVTGLPNRVLFRERLEELLAQAARAGGRLALLFLDLDGFKQVNDTLGHTAGDDLLALVAVRLQSALPPGTFLARLGGDEFTALLPRAEGAATAQAVSEAVLAALADPFPIEDRDVYVRASIGVTLYPEDDQTPGSLLRNADLAMYQAKEAGKNRVQFYEPERQSEVLEQMLLEQALRGALERGEMSLHFQPQIALASRRVVGVEALLRWQHPELGRVSPAKFIPIAESTGLIFPLSDWVLRRACAQAAAWQSEGVPFGRIAVNLTARHFEQVGLPEQIAAVLAEAGVSADVLELELTESNLMEDAGGAAVRLKRLEEMGLRLAVDDFGTGYSSLAYLKRFPIHSLKIDRAFIRDAVADPDSAAIVSAILALAHGLRLNTIAEGVETEEQLLFLRERRCDQVQGYYFSAPLPADEIAPLLRETAVWK